MLKMMNNIKQHRNGERNESGAAMIFALLLLMLLMLVTVIVATTATTQSQSTREVSLREGYLSAANNGIEVALYNANNNITEDWLETKRTIGNAMTGTPPNGANNIDGLRWRIYTERVVTTGNTVAYYVYSTGYTPTLGIDKGITLRSIFQGSKVNSGKYVYQADETVNVAYTLSADGSWAYGLLGTNGMTFSGTSKLYSFDSSKSGGIPTGTSTIGTVASTNTAVELNNTAHGISSIISSYPGVNTGCLPASICNTSPGLTQSYRNSEVNLSGVTENIQSTCTGTGYPLWKASENSGVLNLPANTCLGGIYFDVNTTVPASFTASSPLRLNVLGNVTVKSGVSVNANGAPTKLVIRSTGGDLTANTGTTANRVQFLYTSENATCNVTGAGIFFGGIACANVNVYDSARIYMDLAARSLESITSRHIWVNTYVEEL
jgi:Tfp pilus assembly protein PilX